MSDLQILEKKAAEIHHAFLKKKQTLALAESCTGGLLSYCLSQMAGASDFFLGSIVGYSYQAKIEYLGVSKALLEQKGAVNEEVCCIMAKNTLKNWHSDWALSITGVAGPGKMEKDPPIGNVFVGLCGPFGVQVKQIFLSDKNRQDIRHQSAFFALDFLYSRLK